MGRTQTIGTRPPTSRGAVTAGATFAFLWAGANGIHLLNQTTGDMRPVQWLNFAAVLFVLGRPSSGHRLALLAAAQLLETAAFMPFPPDHQILAALVNLAILATYFSAGRPSDVMSFLDRFSPVARTITLIAYAAAATAKYNSDFLSAGTSCATFLAETASFGAVSRDHPSAVLFVAFTLTCETLVPVLLLLPKTRRWGVLFAATFHFMLSFSPLVGVGDFTMTLWALFCLFLPVTDIEAIVQRLRNTLAPSPIIRRLDALPRWLIAVVAAAGVWLGSKPFDGAAISALVWDVTGLLALWVLVVAGLVMRAQKSPVRPFGRLPRAHAVLVAVVLLLVAGPYLGFGTSARFTMFSGLRTENAGTNHLFLPSFHLIDSQNEGLIVRKESGSSGLLESRVKDHAVVPEPEVRRALRNMAVGGEFETLDGELIRVVPGEDHWLRTQPAWWERTTQHYRSYKLEGETDPHYCSN